MFLDFAKQSSTISKISYYIMFFGLMFWEKISCSYSAVNLGRALFSVFALALDLPENFFDDKVCHTMFSSKWCLWPLCLMIYFDHRPNIQRSLWWSFNTILLKQAHLTSDRLALVLTRSKIQYSLDNLIFWLKFCLTCSWEVVVIFLDAPLYYFLTNGPVFHNPVTTTRHSSSPSFESRETMD